MIWYRIFSLFGVFPWPDEEIFYIPDCPPGFDEFGWRIMYRYFYGIVPYENRYSHLVSSV